MSPNQQRGDQQRGEQTVERYNPAQASFTYASSAVNFFMAGATVIAKAKASPVVGSAPAGVPDIDLDQATVPLPERVWRAPCQGPRQGIPEEVHR